MRDYNLYYSHDDCIVKDFILFLFTPYLVSDMVI